MPNEKSPKFDLSLFKMGHFVLVKRKEKDFVGSRIEKVQLRKGFTEEDSCWTHVIVSGGNQHCINIAPPISRLVDITKQFKGRTIRIVKFIADDYDIKRYKVAYFSAALCANKRYDVAGVLAFLSFLSKWVKQNNRLYFCSEGAATALQKVYPQAFYGDNPSTIMPAHFCLPYFFETAWEGTIPKIKTWVD